MSGTLVVTENDISKLLKEYFQEDIRHHPEEIVYAKKLIDEDEWEWLEDLLHPFNNQEGYPDLVYSIHKHAYLQLLHQNDNTSLPRLTSLMKKINESDKARYNSLLWVESHDLSQLSKHALFIQVAKFMYKYMYPSMSWEAPPTPNCSRLVRLITRGLLYERCEKTCADRKATPTPHDVLDLVTWFHKMITDRHTPPIAPPTLSIDLVQHSRLNEELHHNALTPPIPEIQTDTTPPRYQLSLAKSAPSKVPHSLAQFTTPTKSAAPPSNHPRTSTPRNPVATQATSAAITNELTLTPISRVKQVQSQEPIKAVLLTTIHDKQAIRSISFTNDGGLLAVGANSRILRIFDTSNIRSLVSKETTSLDEVYRRPDYHLGSIYCLSWNASNNLLASGSNDRMINLLYKVQGSSRYEPCGTIKNSGGVVRELKFFDNYLVGVGAGGVRVMNPERLSVTYQSSTNDHTFCVCPIEPHVLVTGDEKGCVTIWDTRQPSPAYVHHSIDHAFDSVTSIDHHNGNISYSTNTGVCYSLQYNHMKSRSVLNWYPHGKTECRSLRYSLNGEWLLTGSYDNTVCVTNANTLVYTTVCQHNDKVIQARWCPTQQLHDSSTSIIATTSADKTTKLWRLTL